MLISSQQGVGHSLSISGDNHGTNMIGLSAQEVHTSSSSQTELIQRLTDEITYLRELIKERDGQLMELVQKVITQKT